MSSDPFVAFRNQLRAREIKRADVQRTRIVGPFGSRGLFRVQDLISGHEFLARAPGRQTFKPGEVVLTGSHLNTPGKVILVGPPPGQLGASTFQPPAFGDPHEIDDVGIESIDPETYFGGESDQAITILGFGFRESPIDSFVVVKPSSTDPTGWTADARYTLDNLAWVSAGEVTGLLDVAASVAADETFSIRVRRA